MSSLAFNHDGSLLAVAVSYTYDQGEKEYVMALTSLTLNDLAVQPSCRFDRRSLSRPKRSNTQIELGKQTCCYFVSHAGRPLVLAIHSKPSLMTLSVARKIQWKSIDLCIVLEKARLARCTRHSISRRVELLRSNMSDYERLTKEVRKPSNHSLFSR